jgi:sulfide dehydrogenase cytochrome subunit
VGTLNMNTSTPRKPLIAVAAWALAVVLGGTTVLSIAARTVAHNLESKVVPALDSNQKSTTTSDIPDGAPALAGEMLAHTCAACHGTQGRLGDESFMPLAGMPTDQFFITMVAFREGKRPATLMGHVARGFSDAELRAMGVYFAGIAPDKGQP